MLESKSFRIGSGLFASVLTILVAGCGGEGPEPGARGPEPAVSLQTLIAAANELPKLIEATGAVEPITRANPGTKVMGRIDAVTVREGDRVQKGQLLAGLERRDLEAAVDQAVAAVAMAEAQRENAAAQLRRMQMLLERGSTTEKSLEDATARARVTTAAAEQAKANLAAAEVMLSYSEIRSPISGWIAAKLAEVGDMTAPGVPLFVIEDLSRVKISVAVPGSDVVDLKAGDRGRVTVDVFDATWSAEIARILPAGDPQSRTFEVQLVLDNPDGKLRSGMFARAVFEHGVRHALLVPANAVVERGQLRGLFVLDEQDRARLRWVRLGRREHDRFEVLSGLAAGERFVAAPPPGLIDGARVERGS
jgi:multidrug efflux system membrane fusion protein